MLALLVVAAVVILRQTYTAPYRVCEGDAFGTTFKVKYKWTESLDNDIIACLQSVDKSMSMFNDSSVVSRINRNETDQVDDMFAEVLKLSQQVSSQTNGYFDVTVKPLVDAWGFGTKQRHCPTAAEIDSIRSFIGYNKVSLNGNKVRKRDARLTLDFSAVAKGYACDVIARHLRRLGLTDFMIEIGGEISCYGSAEKGEGWLIGVSKPTDDTLNNTTDLQTRLLIKNKCVATSGNYHRYYYNNGKKVAHTINPHSGMPVAHTLLSSTVVASQTARADAFATAFMAAGLDSAKQILKHNSELDAYLIYADREGKLHTWQTKGFAKYIYNK